MFPFVIVSDSHSFFVVTALVTVWHIACCLKHTVARLSEVLILLVEVIIQHERQFILDCACMFVLCINIFITY